MARLTGITATTADRLLFGAGTLTVDSTSVGATTGELTFSVESDVYFPQLNGAAGKVQGTGWKVTETAKISCTVTEFTMRNIANALPGLYWGSSTSSETTLASSVGCIDSTEYVSVVYAGQNCKGYDVTLTLSQAIMTENLDVTFKDDGEAQFGLTFEAVYTLADPDARPWSLVIDIA
jgi:hypothetical protein